MKKIILFLISYYQKFFSKDHTNVNLGFCKYTPSCSQYTKICFEKFGILKALSKSMWRILRCNPWSKGGLDYPD